uniref:Transaminase n=1 Tax=Micromonospora griseorubida TaxID=28040 RepID=Q83WE5_MICGR|nr:transaminase [Micromonospora griseorubida]
MTLVASSADALSATTPTVPFLDVGAAYHELRDEIDAACRRVLASGWYLLGPEIEAFEAEFAAYCGSGYCVAVNSGCDALELALRGLGIGPGDEVVVPSHTFVASWLAVTATGATPVPVEPDAHRPTIAAELVEAAITPRTRAILPVHLYGEPADLDALHDVADRHGLHVVEDAAQAVGARYRGRRIGAAPGVVAFSFYPGKNLGAFGDGGAVVTDDPQLAARVRLLRNYGSARKYEHEMQGRNSRLDEIQAAVLRVKLPHLDRWNRRRAAVAQRYLTGLAGCPGIRLPQPPRDTDPAWHLFVVRAARREDLRRHLARAGIDTLVHYPVPVHRSGAYASTPLPPGGLPRAERLADEVLSLPIGPHLGTAHVDRVIEVVRAWAG